MRKNNWLKGAIILGFSFFIAILLVRPIGVSTQFSVVSGMVHNLIEKDVIVSDSTRESGYRSSNEYYDKSDGKIAEAIKNPINYELVFVLSIPLGSFLAFMLIKNKRDKESRGKIEKTCGVKKSDGTLSSYIFVFFGGFILLYGARMADGCTSGHMMSGMMQGSVSGYFFAMAVFIVAIPVAIIGKRLRSRK